MKINFKDQVTKLILILFSLYLLNGCATFHQNDQALIPHLKNELFMATQSEDFLSLTFFNPKENRMVTSLKIPFVDELSHSSYNASGANDSAQYNPKTKEVFFSTQGYSDYGFSCVNEDSTCLSRIYKIGIDETEPKVLFESQEVPQWIINPSDNSILMIFNKGGIESIKKINIADGSTFFTKLYPTTPGKYFANLVLSKDSQFTYQAGYHSAPASAIDQTLWLRKIDNQTGEITEQKIYEGDGFEFETSLSPDNRYLAFYSGFYEEQHNKKNLFIFDLSTEKLTEVPFGGLVANYNLFWSGNSARLLYFGANKGLEYYDLKTAKIYALKGEAESSHYIYGWAPSVDYLAYDLDNQVKIYDLKNHKTLSLPSNQSDDGIKGLAWY